MSELPPFAGTSTAESCAAAPHAAPKPSRRHTRRWILLCGFLMVVAALIFWRPLQQGTLAFFLLYSEAPADETLSLAAEQASDPGAFLTSLWRTERIPHRQFVIGYLRRISKTDSNLFQSLEQLLMEAVSDADVEVRQLAFGALVQESHSDLRELAVAQLSDADPAARLIGLQTLRRIADNREVPIAIKLLGDPEPRVAVAAALLLREVTGNDFGIKSTHALPQFTCIDLEPPPAPDLPAIAQGIQRWKLWWTEHEAEYPVGELPSAWSALTLAVRDFSLPDTLDKPVRLSQYRGKAVLLAFWSVDAPASLDDARSLGNIQKHNAERLSVLGISVPFSTDCSDGHEHAQDTELDHHSHSSSSSALKSRTMRSRVQEMAERHRIDFPLLIDEAGAVGPRFKAEDLPVYVLIDSSGMLRRRCVGFRTEQALTAMVNELFPEADPHSCCAH